MHALHRRHGKEADGAGDAPPGRDGAAERRQAEAGERTDREDHQGAESARGAQRLRRRDEDGEPLVGRRQRAEREQQPRSRHGEQHAPHPARRRAGCEERSAGQDEGRQAGEQRPRRAGPEGVAPELVVQIRRRREVAQQRAADAARVARRRALALQLQVGVQHRVEHGQRGPGTRRGSVYASASPLG